MVLKNLPLWFFSVYPFGSLEFTPLIL